MLGLFPNTTNADAIDASIAIPMQPAPPPGARPLGPGNDPGDPRNQPRTKPVASRHAPLRNTGNVPPRDKADAPPRDAVNAPSRDAERLRHEISFRNPMPDAATGEHPDAAR